MANKKPKIQLVPPFTGVRRDVNPLVQDQTMADKGDNCLFFDGTIRPRPCMTKEVSDPVSGEDIFLQYPELYNTESLAIAAGDSYIIYAACETDDGYMLAATYESPATRRIDLSIDNGMTWTQGGVSTPGAATCYHIEEKNGFIFAFLYGGEVYRAPASGLPSALSWTQIVASLGITIAAECHFFYDDTNDAWLVFNPNTSNWALGIVYDASASASGSAPTIPSYTGDASKNGCAWINDSYFVVASAANVGNGGEQYLEAFNVEWNGSTYTVGTSFTDTITIMNFNGSVNRTPITDTANANATVGAAILDSYQNNGFVFSVFHNSTESFIGCLGLDSSGLFVDDNEGYIPVSTVDKDVTDSIEQGNLLAIMETEINNTSFPTYLVSQNGGMTWMRFFDNRTYSGESVASYRFGAAQNNHLMFSQINGATENYSILHSLPSTTDGVLIGDVTTAFQADLSDEDRVLIIGATHGIARLNRTTNEWDRITANDDETIDHAPTGVWVDEDTTFDIPPLSAYPDDTSYVAGTSINGVYGTNPWVFRTFEAQGETFLIGTNGQCYPICYHPDMPGGFARRLGEMTEDDPNYAALADSPFGDLAPKAKCIATAANRVLLANDPAGSKFSVSVGGFNDQDREWGDAQQVLLGDTSGGIVSMNEISALQVAIYKEDAIYHAIAQTEFLGVSAPFRFELSKAGISGPCSPASVVRNHDGRQMYLARDGGVYLYDGVAPIDLGANVRKMVQNDIDLDSLGKCWGVVDVKRKLIWFFYPTSDGLVNKGIVISTDQGVPYPVWPIVLPRGWDFVTGLDAILTTDITIGELGVLDSYDDDVTLGSFSSGKTAMLMGLKTGIFFSQEYEERSEQYTDDGVPIQIHLRGGWLTPGGAEVFTADTLHHIFSCTDPEQELEVRLRAQQLGRNIRVSKSSPLSSGKRQRRTRHRVSGTQFSVDIQGNIKRLFNWGGGALSLVKRGGR